LLYSSLSVEQNNGLSVIAMMIIYIKSDILYNDVIYKKYLNNSHYIKIINNFSKLNEKTKNIILFVIDQIILLDSDNNNKIFYKSVLEKLKSMRGGNINNKFNSLNKYNKYENKYNNLIQTIK
jgi:hypothetical protein